MGRAEEGTEVSLTACAAGVFRATVARVALHPDRGGASAEDCHADGASMLSSGQGLFVPDGARLKVSGGDFTRGSQRSLIGSGNRARLEIQKTCR
ncbi:MAG: hypothetical protein LAP21_17260 [Acidobacteriia bacterium]|nr:hypothetical protein [Terriglobia bacterium]